MTQSAFVRLLHADWSTTAAKRWVVEARKIAGHWLVQAPRLVGPTDQFVEDLLQEPQPTLAGFDFPIGIPASFGRKTEFGSFTEAIQQFGTGKWSRFYEVAEQPDDISVYRPFYPRLSSSSARQLHLLTALGVEDIHALKRQCEKATTERRAACSLFWTLGGNQVGKAAISGWHEIVQPSRRGGALLWPFEGDLSSLAGRSKLVICETYPAEAYGHVGIRSSTGGSKQRQDDRRSATAQVASRCQAHGVHLNEEMKEVLADGFGPRKSGEDPFDAVAGLLGMIEVVEGRRVAAPVKAEAPEWEGWILGQAS
jgi:hypothetical protein